MTEIIDISIPLRRGMPVWPGSTGFDLVQTMHLGNGDPANVSHLSCDLHVGTHIDAPWHFVAGGKTAEQLPLEILLGPAQVASLSEVREIAAEHLEQLSLALDVRRLLLQTSNSKLWAAGVSEFRSDFAALTPSAAQWVVDRGIRLIGVDYLSVQLYGADSRTHEILLDAEVVVLEGLNLAEVEPGEYELLCLPLKLVGADGAPARAVLRRPRADSSQGES